jgi:hypothetical protein
VEHAKEHADEATAGTLESEMDNLEDAIGALGKDDLEKAQAEKQRGKDALDDCIARLRALLRHLGLDDDSVLQFS